MFLAWPLFFLQETNTYYLGTLEWKECRKEAAGMILSLKVSFEDNFSSS